MKKIFLASICCLMLNLGFAQSDVYIIDSTICFQYNEDFGALLPSTREVTLESNPSGNILKKRTDIYSIDMGGWLPQNLITATFDNAENLTLSLVQEWDAANQAFENKTQTIYTLNSAGQPTEVIKQTWGGSTWANAEKESYEYESGLGVGATLFLSQTWGNGTWVNVFQVLNSYNAQNLLASTFFQTFSNGEWVNGNRSFETYNSDNLIANSRREFWNVDIADWVLSSQIIYSYQGQDNTEALTQQWDGFNEIWLNTNLVTNIFNNNHQIIEHLSQVWLNDTWTNLFRSRFQHDAAGNLIRSEGDLFTEGNWRPQNACDLYWSLFATPIFEPITNQIHCSFPNPFRAGSTITCEDLDFGKSYELVVFDINGIQHFTKKITETNDVSIHKNLPQGMYILVVKNEDGLVFRQKFIKD